MSIALLVICTDKLSTPIYEAFGNLDFTLSFGRGCLKAREILRKQHPEAVLWLTQDFAPGLIADLADLLNHNKDIPVILLLDDVSEDLPGEDLQGLFAKLDLTEKPEEIINTVLQACGQQPILEKQIHNQPFEMDFKNAVNQIIQNKEEETDNSNQPSLNLLTPWVAVDSNEKKIIADRRPSKEPILSKVKNWIIRD